MSRRLHPRGALIDLGISIDASMSWGIGIIVKGQWAAFCLSPDWKVRGQDICWLETLAIDDEPPGSVHSEFTDFPC